MKSLKYFALTILLAVLNVPSVFAAYFIDKSSTTVGDSLWEQPVLKMTASLNGTDVTFDVSKIDGGYFGSDGTMYLKVGTYRDIGADRDSGNVAANVTRTLSFSHDLDDYLGIAWEDSPTGYPKEFYFRYETPEGGWAWVGPIWVSYEADVVPEPTVPGDTNDPQVEITGIQSSYVVGDTISYTITATDNNALSGLDFLVEDADGNEQHHNRWNDGGDFFKTSDDFSTAGWPLGWYGYSSFVEDAAGNQELVDGDGFLLVEDTTSLPPDDPITPPVDDPVEPPPVQLPVEIPTEPLKLDQLDNNQVVVSTPAGFYAHIYPTINSAFVDVNGKDGGNTEDIIPYNTILTVEKAVRNWLKVSFEGTDGYAKEGWIHRTAIAGHIPDLPARTPKKDGTVSWAHKMTADLRMLPNNSINGIIWEIYEDSTVQIIDNSHPFYFVKIEKPARNLDSETTGQYGRLYVHPDANLDLNVLQTGISGWVHQEFIMRDGQTYDTPLAYPFDYETAKSAPIAEKGLVNQIFFEEVMGQIHECVDYNLEEGAPVRTAAHGTVIFAGLLEGLGNTVVLGHDNGYFTAYAHLQTIVSEILTQKIIEVDRGIEIGTVGGTADHDAGSKKPHLHFCVRNDGEPQKSENWQNALNPTKYVTGYDARDAHQCMKEMIVDAGIRNSNQITQNCPEVGTGGNNAETEQELLERGVNNTCQANKETCVGKVGRVVQRGFDFHYQVDGKWESKKLPLGTKFTILEKVKDCNPTCAKGEHDLRIGFNVTENNTYQYSGNIDGSSDSDKYWEVFDIEANSVTEKTAYTGAKVRLYPHVEDNSLLPDCYGYGCPEGQQIPKVFYVHEFLGPFSSKKQGGCENLKWALASYKGHSQEFGEIAKLGYVCEIGFDLPKFVYPIEGLSRDTHCPSDESEMARQDDLFRSWYSTVWGGKYDGNWDKRCKGSGGHPGVDIRVVSGTQVRAIGSGTVYKSQDSSSWGGLIVIKHTLPGTDETVWSIYAHLKQRDVKVGDTTYAGMPIGLSGGAISDPNHGSSTGSHLHFQIDKGESFATPYYKSANAIDQNLSANTYDPLKFIEDMENPKVAKCFDDKEEVGGKFIYFHPKGESIVAQEVGRVQLLWSEKCQANWAYVTLSPGVYHSDSSVKIKAEVFRADGVTANIPTPLLEVTNDNSEWSQWVDGQYTMWSPMVYAPTQCAYANGEIHIDKIGDHGEEISDKGYATAKQRGDCPVHDNAHSPVEGIHIENENWKKVVYMGNTKVEEFSNEGDEKTYVYYESTLAYKKLEPIRERYKCEISREDFYQAFDIKGYEAKYGIPCLVETKPFGSVEHTYAFFTDGAWFSSPGRYEYWVTETKARDVIFKLHGTTEKTGEDVILPNEGNFRFSPLVGTYIWYGAEDDVFEDDHLTAYYEPNENGGKGHAVYGSILNKLMWQYFASPDFLCNVGDIYCGKPGWVVNYLGFPTGDKRQAATYDTSKLFDEVSGYYQDFIGGQIYEGDGTHYVFGPAVGVLDKEGGSGTFGFPTEEPYYSEEKYGLVQLFSSQKEIILGGKVSDIQAGKVEIRIEKGEELIKDEFFLEGFYDAFAEMDIHGIAVTFTTGVTTGVILLKAKGPLMKKFGKLAATKALAKVGARFVPGVGWAFAGYSAAVTAIQLEPLVNACNSGSDTDGMPPAYYCGKLGAYGTLIAAGLIAEIGPHALKNAYGAVKSSYGQLGNAIRNGKAKLFARVKPNDVDKWAELSGTLRANKGTRDAFYELQDRFDLEDMDLLLKNSQAIQRLASKTHDKLITVSGFVKSGLYRGRVRYRYNPRYKNSGEYLKYSKPDQFDTVKMRQDGLLKKDGFYALDELDDAIKIFHDKGLKDLNGEIIFVLKKDGTMSIAPRRGTDKLPHPYLSGGDDVVSAGVITPNQGGRLTLSNKTGHFQVHAEDIAPVETLLKNKGYAVQVKPYNP